MNRLHVYLKLKTMISETEIQNLTSGKCTAEYIKDVKREKTFKKHLLSKIPEGVLFTYSFEFQVFHQWNILSL